MSEQEQAAAEAGVESADQSAQTIRIIGDATPEETAALVAVLSGLSGGAEETPAPRPSGWTDRRRLVRSPLSHGRGNWRASAQPR
ncbi:acyl-CoA carboxylase subunit epsilon [Janibacter sp. G56]|uniref:acyl-CoA carboxylase subunit epsilon n=1 Tax=Janibacter sp. G56 TaxID=3418717 RepID=UPI003D00A7E0